MDSLLVSPKAGVVIMNIKRVILYNVLVGVCIIWEPLFYSLNKWKLQRRHCRGRGNRFETPSGIGCGKGVLFLQVEDFFKSGSQISGIS